MIDNKQLWDGVLAEMEITLSKANFSTWFRNTAIHKQEDNIIFVGVPNTFVRDWLYNKYHKNILRILRTLDAEIRSIEYLISKLETREETRPKELVFRNQTNLNELGLNELYINRDSNLNPRYTLASFIVGAFNEVAYAAAQAVMAEPGVKYNPLFIYGGTGLGKTHLIQSIGNYCQTHT
ncbi:MAG: DnaA/Hda family protein, partial [Patescibacteria group bacterium]